MKRFTLEKASNAKVAEAMVTLGMPKAWGTQLSFPAGWTCPGADKCMVRADRETGLNLVRGKANEYDCFAAGHEFRPDCREQRWSNFDLMVALLREGGPELAGQVLADSLGKNKRLVRVCDSGDLWSEDVFRAVMVAAKLTPNVVWYGYTKSLKAYSKVRHEIHEIDNLRYTISFGGKWDDLALAWEKDGSEIIARVYMTEADVPDGMEICYDEIPAIRKNGRRSFALILHGRQEAGTERAKVAHANSRDKTDWRIAYSIRGDLEADVWGI